jgi:hypothetical protein
VTRLVKELFDLPETVRKSDFVEKIVDAVAHAERTAETFVATPALTEALDRALALVGSALRDGRGQAAYLHGSFGSGKSHFMAMLSLLSSGHDAAWRKPELHALRDKHAFAGRAKLLELHFHMMGKESVDSAVFGPYLAHVQKHHPEKPMPALFADEELFADARTLLDELGETKVFAPLNAGSAPADGWGELVDGWDRARFEAAIASSDGARRGELFAVLAKSWFKSVDRVGTYVDFDHGLGVLCRHAKGLGYDAVVLFLDELILALAHRALALGHRAFGELPSPRGASRRTSSCRRGSRRASGSTRAAASASTCSAGRRAMRAARRSSRRWRTRAPRACGLRCSSTSRPRWARPGPRCGPRGSEGRARWR